MAEAQDFILGNDDTDENSLVIRCCKCQDVYGTSILKATLSQEALDGFHRDDLYTWVCPLCGGPPIKEGS